MLAVLTSDQLSPRDVPARRHRPRPRCAPRRRGAASRWRTSRTATTSASSPTATPGASWPGTWARRRAGSSTPPVPSLGEHQGAYGFTVGQRKGLRVGTPAGDGRPRYVLDIEPVTRTVTVGPAEGLDITEITATRPVWTGCAPPPQPVTCQVQLRAHGEVHACTAWTGRRRGAHPPAPPGPRRGQGPGRRPLRRRHRPRQRHHQRHVRRDIAVACLLTGAPDDSSPAIGAPSGSGRTRQIAAASAWTGCGDLAQTCSGSVGTPRSVPVRPAQGLLVSRF